LKFVKFVYELKNMLLHIFRLEAKATFFPVEAPAQIKCERLSPIAKRSMGPHHVETAVRKRQSQDVTDLVAGQGVQTGSLREELGYGNKRRRKICADNATAF
jgi:hypothetical protein